MEYYEITQKGQTGNVIYPQKSAYKGIWERTEPVFVPGRAKKPKEELIFLPLYEGDAFLISAAMQVVWQEYQNGGRYRPCAFGSVEQRQVLPYSFAVPRILDCIHPDTQYYKNNTIQELILAQTGVGAHRVFGVRTLHSIRLIFAEDVLEAIIRENMTRFQWEPVSVR